uniref:Uncharacterized protein n=1 Tax=Ochrobactrum sp. PW1 TaxID=1882222 RepID=A0A292GJM6_9HYPH|nr:hypothetical protein [Ochrobactrum sp. PW1]
MQGFFGFSGSVHPDWISFPPSASLSPGWLLGGLPLARRKGPLALDRDGFPGLPPFQSVQAG